MAKCTTVLPDDILGDLKKITDNLEKICGEMVDAGAETVVRNVKSFAPLPELAGSVVKSKTYKTPSDGGVNKKVYFKGYFPLRNGRKTFARRGRSGGSKYSTTKGVPAAFVAQAIEYGTSQRFTDEGNYRGFVGKRPFFRKSFRPSEIEAAMKAAQKKASGGIIDE